MLDNAAREKFNSAVEGLAADDLVNVAKLGHSAINSIITDHLGVYSDLSIKTPTHFTLVPFGDPAQGLFVPGILVNEKIVSETGFKPLKADVLRTIAIATQFPDKGFERRLPESMIGALDIQKKWLEKNITGQVLNDPRQESLQRLAQTLLGDESYFAGFGWDDWTAAINSWLPDAAGDDKKKLQMAQDSKIHFIVERHRHIQTLYPIMQAQESPGFFDNDPKNVNKRMLRAAQVVLGISVTYGQLPSDNNFNLSA